jgi:hypothetical protein
LSAEEGTFIKYKKPENARTCNFWVPDGLKKKMDWLIDHDFYLTRSELIRHYIMQGIMNDYNNIWGELANERLKKDAKDD